MLKIFKGVDRLLEISLVLILFAMAVCVFLQIIFRYLLGASLEWSEELARFLQVWLTFLGAGYAIKGASHIAMDDILNRLPKTAKTVLTVVGDLLVIGISLFFMIEGTKILGVTKTQISPGNGISMMYIYLAIPVGATVGIYYMVIRWVEKLFVNKGGEI